MLYGVEQTITYIAWDTSANAGKTGDAANHTLRWVKNGTSAAPTNSASEVDGTNAPGVYKITLTATEWETYQGTLAGKSSTANVAIIPQQFTTVRLPNAVPGQSGGIALLGSQMNLADDAITSAKFDESTAFPLKSADTGATAVSRLTAAQVNAEADAALFDVGLTTTVTGRIDAAISSRSTLDGTGAQAAAAAALTAYDPPTKGELDSAVLPLATAAALETVDNFIDTEVSAIKAVTDKLDSMLVADGPVYKFTTNALEQAPSGGSGGTVGPGATSWTITVTVSGVPIADADVWITTDSAGTNVVAGTLQTNSVGQATFLLDAGVTYYAWMQKDGYNPIKGSAFTVTA